MAIQLGQIAPDFEQDSTHGPIHFHDWLGSSWAVLFSHPKNLTPVMERCIERDLDGHFDLVFDPAGVCCHMVIPYG